MTGLALVLELFGINNDDDFMKRLQHLPKVEADLIVVANGDPKLIGESLATSLPSSSFFLSFDLITGILDYVL